MKIFLLLSCTLGLLKATNCQILPSSEESPFAYFNNVQYYKYKNYDSAFLNLQKLASAKGDLFLLRDLIHDAIAQSYLYDNKENISFTDKIVSHAAVDSNKDLATCIKPLFLWSATLSANSITQLKTACETYLNEVLIPSQIYTNYSARYGLAIYNRIVQIEELKPLADRYLNTINDYVENAPRQYYDSLTREQNSERAWNLYYYACINYLKALGAVNSNAKKDYLKIAADNSPGIKESMIGSFFYDQFFIFNGKANDSFKDEYISFLIKQFNSDKKEILSELTQYAILNTDYKDNLKLYYNRNNSQKKSFNAYWLEAINNNSKNYPALELNQLDNTKFSSKAYRGKWILLDFWGTWCVPCRKEHPKLQEYYDAVIRPDSSNIILMTIASQDSRENVEKYMHDMKYTFPVCFDDKDIYKTYNIMGFPGKILITPEGKFFQVESAGWMESVSRYCDLENN